jgi:hypothetical protein
MVNGRCADATASRCFSTAGSSSVSTSVGPSSVTCAGTYAAWGSPAAPRRRVSADPHGSGMSMATPIRVVGPVLAAT